MAFPLGMGLLYIDIHIYRLPRWCEWYRTHSPANVGDIRDVGSISGSGRSPGGGHCNPLQYSYLESPMHRRVTESWTRLMRHSTHTHMHIYTYVCIYVTHWYIHIHSSLVKCVIFFHFWVVSNTSVCGTRRNMNNIPKLKLFKRLKWIIASIWNMLYTQEENLCLIWIATKYHT